MAAVRAKRAAFNFINMPKGRPKQKSEYGKQLDEKQELRGTYALRERQFRKYFRAGSSPESIFKLLEMRIDNTVYRAGFGESIKAARQIVSHGHVQINGKNVDIPSLQVKLNDIISIHRLSIKKELFKDLVIRLKKYEPPAWIALDAENLTAKITGHPSAQDPITASRIKPVIEFYSR